MEIKDSGKRVAFDSGMVRDITDGKIDYSLALDGPMFERWARHLTAGAKKYAKRNWMKAAGQDELDRFRESALRHFMQWYRGDADEDHAAAVLFNVNGAEYVKQQTNEKLQMVIDRLTGDDDPMNTFAGESEPCSEFNPVGRYVYTRKKGHGGKHHAHLGPRQPCVGEDAIW